MRAVGVREIKNKLSEYLRLVRRGETVLVTDRGRVIAQLAPPPTYGPPALSEEEALGRLAAAGKLRLPRNKVPSPGEGPITRVSPEELSAALDELRADGGAGE
jgi:prevent-host-death family protein